MRTEPQLELPLPKRGGSRKGAGRPAKGPRALVSHAARPRFGRPTPVHVSVRIVERVWNLRSKRCFAVISAAFAAARGRFGLRIIEFAILGNHLHLIVEADSSEALSRGMQGLGVRIAKNLNRLMRSRGPVFSDHYHASTLDTPTRLVNAIAYVLGNAAHHYGTASGPDPFSSAACDRALLLCAGVSWLVRIGWRRAPRIPPAFPSLLGSAPLDSPRAAA